MTLRFARPAFVLGIALLAGCSTTPRREPPPAPASPPMQPVPPPTVSGPPKNLDEIPDAIPKVEPRSRQGNPPFYNVLGKRYYVLESAKGYAERGVASWYGPTFHGESTSNGEKYDMYAMSAAHKTLPLPSYVRVTNLRNGKSVVVRVNDRGPFVANRVIDLSNTAAAKLDMIRSGTTLVEVRSVTPDDPDELARSEQRPAAEIYVQAGAFAEERNAQRLVEKLKAGGISTAAVLAAPKDARKLYRVRVGPVANVAEFDKLTSWLTQLGVPDARLAMD